MKKIINFIKRFFKSFDKNLQKRIDFTKDL
jgi:hypothetical protein